MYQTEHHISQKSEGTPTFKYLQELQTIGRSSNFSKNDEIQTKTDEYRSKHAEFRPETIYEISSNSSQNDHCKNVQQNGEETYAGDGQNFVLDVKQTKEVQNLPPRKKKNDKYSSAFEGPLASVVNNLPANTITSKKNDKITSSLGSQAKRKNTVINQIEAEEDCKIYKDGGWSRTKLMLKQNTLSFFQFSCEMDDLQKIKIIPETTSKTKIENVIKLQVNGHAHLFSLSLDKKIYGLPTAFYVFAKVIDKKMGLLGFQMDDEWIRCERVEKQATQDSYIYGTILKKSQHLGNWEHRFVVIKKNGIFSYRDSKQQQSYSFHINSDSIKYIWTRFNLMNDYLIIKVKHGIYKTEFGIPITQFSNRTTKNWLYYFYRIMPIPAIQK